MENPPRRRWSLVSGTGTVRPEGAGRREVFAVYAVEDHLSGPLKEA